MQLASCSIRFTPEQVKALEETRRKLNFTPQEVEERQRRMQADMDWIAAADTLEEQQRRGGEVWERRVERPRAARRIEAARRPRVVAMIIPRPRAREHRPAVSRRSSSSSRTSSTDPGGDPDPEPPDLPPDVWPTLWASVGRSADEHVEREWEVGL